MNRRVGMYYLVGAILLALLAFTATPWTLPFLWPAASLAVITAGYFGAGPRIYGKRNGGHPLWSRTLHFFPFLGHELSRQHYARGCNAWDELLPGLLIGRQLNEKEALALKQEGVTAVLDLTSEFEEPQTLTDLHYLNVPLLDLTPPSQAQLEKALAFIDQHIPDGKVYIHCKIGYSRTASFAGTYLLRRGHATDAQEAMAALRAARPSMFIRPEAGATISGKHAS
ncbi:MAG: dual specificity protein phosphatase family protein [Puniceicoccaceae bacterium]